MGTTIPDRRKALIPEKPLVAMPKHRQRDGALTPKRFKTPRVGCRRGQPREEDFSQRFVLLQISKITTILRRMAEGD
jgi:hypothetical protein